MLATNAGPSRLYPTTLEKVCFGLPTHVSGKLSLSRGPPPCGLEPRAVVNEGVAPDLGLDLGSLDQARAGLVLFPKGTTQPISIEIQTGIDDIGRLGTCGDVSWCFVSISLNSPWRASGTKRNSLNRVEQLPENMRR